jgi:hypothetical protein
MSSPNGEKASQAAALIQQLPARLKVLIVILILGLQSTFFALRDTVIAKLCAWYLPYLRLYGYHIPAWIAFAASHLYLFLSRQTSWRKSAVTLRRFFSRDDADDDLITEFYLNASDLIFYVLMSLIFRNISVLWGFFVGTLLAVYPAVELICLTAILWFCTIDNPRATFNTEAAKVWNLARPKITSCVLKIWEFFVIVMRHCSTIVFKCMASLASYRDVRTMNLVATFDKYEYSSLGDGEIRLLKLSKWAPFSPVRCELVHVRLDKAPEFETISYTWGVQRTMRPLVMNGRRHDVSERVYDIVHDRASFLMTRCIWLDFICINQGDDNEKSSQVQLMKKIYGSSRHTVVCLGHAPDANDAIGLLAHLRRRMDFDDPVKRASLPPTELNIESPLWPALNNLIKHDYWARCWIIQEIAVSRKVIVSYGGEMITWDYFSTMMQTIFHHDPNSVWHISKIYWRSLLRPPMDEGLQIASLVGVRERFQNSQSVELFDLLIASINSSATDPRDNIFAVQGISSAADSGDIMPDYTSTIDRPFLDTAAYLLRDKYNSRLLHLAGIGYYRRRDLPSWVPDWSTRRLSRMFWRRSDDAPYCSSGTIDERPDMMLGPDGLTLIVTGIRVDRILEVGPRFFGVSENGVPKTSMFSGFIDYAETRDMALRRARTEPYLTGIPLAEAFWRTLIGDRTPTGTRPAEASFSMYFEALERSLETLSKYGPDMNPFNSKVPLEVQEALNVSLSRDAAAFGRFANMSGPQTRERRFAITERGYMGMIPPYSEIGDVVFIIPGAQVPFLLRCKEGTDDGLDVPSEKKWQLVGESYFQGMMDGEMLHDGRAEQKLEIC